VISAFIAWRIRALLVGRSADPEIQAAIDEVIAAQESIECVFNTITVQYGPDTMLAAKIKLVDGISINSAVRDINELERELKQRIPNLKWLFIEPDITD